MICSVSRVCDRPFFFFDISCFKAINDLFQTETGNLILKTAAYYFQAIIGEEGIVLLENNKLPKIEVMLLKICFLILRLLNVEVVKLVLKDLKLKMVQKFLFG